MVDAPHRGSDGILSGIPSGNEFQGYLQIPDLQLIRQFIEHHGIQRKRSVVFKVENNARIITQTENPRGFSDSRYPGITLVQQKNICDCHGNHQGNDQLADKKYDRKGKSECA
jgi:hypothetical protein